MTGGNANTATCRAAFAAHFDAKTEIPLLNAILLTIIRDGTVDVDSAYTALEIALRDGLRAAASRRDKERHAKLDTIIYCFEHFPEEACDYIGYYLWWESLSPAEKQAEREPQRLAAVANHQRQHPASEKQMAYLRALGYSGPVASRKHASDIIEAITNRGAA